MQPTTGISNIVNASITSLGWRWGDAGIVVNIQTEQGIDIPVFVSLAELWGHFRRYLPLQQSVGCTTTAVGFWGAIKRAARSVSRGIKSVARKVVPKAVQRAARSVVRFAGKAIKTVAAAATSDIAAYALMGLSLVPGLTPFTAGLLAAQQALKRVDVGIKAAESLFRGVKRTPQILKALSDGDAAKKLLTQVASNAAQGKPVAPGILAGLKQTAGVR
jgi:hypothetical protein